MHTMMDRLVAGEGRHATQEEGRVERERGTACEAHIYHEEPSATSFSSWRHQKGRRHNTSPSKLQRLSGPRAGRMYGVLYRVGQLYPV